MRKSYCEHHVSTPLQIRALSGVRSSERTVQDNLQGLNMTGNLQHTTEGTPTPPSPRKSGLKTQIYVTIAAVCVKKCNINFSSNK